MEYRRLSTLFRVELTTFERKRYVNLSDEPNKAMNLNSYIGLLGKAVEEVRRGDQFHLEVREPGHRDGEKVIPDATYVLTLDADSLLMPDYALRMVDVMERPGNERLAVVQTPYTAIPDQPGVLERIAGATTDMQYIVHQGFSWVGATFWVGANALLRKTALDDIRTESSDANNAARFIQDRTVIEDTESTVDLVARGWWLHNYSERLAYSATPPDFGALLVQRHRWANGGLLIVPKLLRYALAGPFHARKPVEILVRFHYLVSIAAGSIGFLVLVLVPLDQDVHSLWLPVTAVPYFLLFWRDLIQAGYRKGDILRVYAFNVMLMPINLAGAAKSIHQSITGRKTPFGRTPKVEGRTSAPAWAILAEWLLLSYTLFAFVWDAFAGRWLHALFSLATVVTLAYVLVVFIGLRAGFDDVLASLRRSPLRKPAGRIETTRSTSASG
ncbi:MAG: cellulose synthase catalytic subunit-like protein [uncultured Thermomicrobiales bacterium]|uniref:Cellulose synthase catalytic subunit-like protein n=1 Tax=uncultured Thermomicrobiales bacterium TaxID=1645740 RepID=A0A6J4UIX1_9BACT|nr:MAG: cellulose synthase catalytic subunit-like protein [uncultured Thermomicrobiales bacterium]